MIHIHIDFETKSRRDLLVVGARKYMECPDFGIVWLSFAIGDGPVTRFDMYHEPYPGFMLHRFAPDLLAMMRSQTIGEFLFWAWNAPFEILALFYYLGIRVQMENWRCAMVLAGYFGLPRKLGECAKALNLDQLKDARGKQLIKLFSSPQAKPLKKYNGAMWITPEMEPQQWQEYGEYNAQDVAVERAIVHYCMQWPGPSDDEWRYWRQNELVNDRGLYIDVPFVNACIDVCADYLTEKRQEWDALTGGINPRSNPLVVKWAKDQGVHVPSLAKDYLIDHVDTDLLPPKVAKMLEIRSSFSKTSISKYQTALNWLCLDERIHDQIQHYGADTGRFAGRGMQPHNLPKTFSNENLVKRNAKRLGVPIEVIEELVGNALETAKNAIVGGAGALLYRDVTAVVGKMQRTAIIAPPGYVLVPCDYSSIENIMLAWVAGEEWQLDVFRRKGDIYIATAARMFNILEEEVTGEQRDKGKRATLALGYQGWVGAMISSGALRAGMLESELPAVCKGWRETSPAIAAPKHMWRGGVKRENPNMGLWAKLETAASYVIRTGVAFDVVLPYCTIKFSMERGNMFITLPSGRRLCYHNAHAVGDDVIRYIGLRTIPGTTKKVWGSVDLYGGLLTENVIQAMARDCLVWCMDGMHQDGLPIILHVHDEIVPEVPAQFGEQVLAYMEHRMSLTPPWATGLPIRAKGFITPFYCK